MRTPSPRHRSPIMLLGLGLVASLALGGCGSSSSKEPANSTAAQKTTVKTVVEGKLTVCTNPPYAPFEDVEDGQLVGFDLDLTGEIAKDLGLELSGRQTPFEAIESAVALDVGDCDIGASALTISDERAAKADFSTPYYDAAMGLLVGPASGIKSIDDLGGRSVGVQQGTTGEKWAKENLEADQVRQYEHLGDQITAFLADEIDGVINDVPTLEPFKSGGMDIITGLSDSETFGLMVKKGNTALLAEVNKTLARVKDDGTYAQLIAKWFAQAAARE